MYVYLVALDFFGVHDLLLDLLPEYCVRGDLGVQVQTGGAADEAFRRLLARIGVDGLLERANLAVEHFKLLMADDIPELIPWFLQKRAM